MLKSLELKSINKNLEILENERKIHAANAYTPLLSLSYQLTPMTYNPWAEKYFEKTKSWNFQEDNGIGIGTFTAAFSIYLDNFIPGSSANVMQENFKDQISLLKLNIKNRMIKKEVEILNTISKIKNLEDQLRVNDMNITIAKKAYDMTNNAYLSGTKQLLDVESSQNDLLSAEVTLLGGKYNYLSELLNLEYLLNREIDE